MSEATTMGVNLLLEDDYDEDETPRERVKEAKPAETPEASEAAKRRGTPRVKVTPKDAVILAFLGKMRVATVEALSLLSYADDFPGSSRTTRSLTSIEVTRGRLDKLRRLGHVQRDRLPNGTYIFAATEKGRGAAVMEGYDGDSMDPQGFGGLAWSDLPHRLAISMVAAQLSSPRKVTKSHTTGTIDNLVSEHTIRSHVEGLIRAPKARAKAEDRKWSFMEWKRTRTQELRDELQAGAIVSAGLERTL